MRSMVLRGSDLAIEERPVPEPGAGQVLARVLACGICGSDLHAAKYGIEAVSGGLNSGGGAGDGVIMGHEFVARVERLGDGVTNVAPGDRVTSVPGLITPDGGFTTIGYSDVYPGAYGEYVLMSGPMLLKVPDNVSDSVAATTEPCAVGLHAVRAFDIDADDEVVIMGAGPIGLMCLLWLKQQGVRNVTVSDPAAARRAMATRVGADRVVDPTAEPVVANADDRMRLAPQVVFDAVGVEGTLQEALDLVGRGGRIVVVGVCMTEDTLRPMTGIFKEALIKFVLGYTPQEYAEALGALAEGSIDTAPLVTREVGLDELPGAFMALSNPQECKVVLKP